jgi:hypothetical protein
MDPSTKYRTLDRHALVTAIWLALGFVAIALFDHGFAAGGPAFHLWAFGVIAAAFVGHVIVNAVFKTVFTARELALGLIAYAVALVAFGVATLLSPEFAERNFAALSVGLVALFAMVVFYMITHFGARRVFDAFDVIRDFKPDEERRPHRRGGSR